MRELRLGHDAPFAGRRISRGFFVNEQDDTTSWGERVDAEMTAGSARAWGPRRQFLSGAAPPPFTEKQLREMDGRPRVGRPGRDLLP